MSLSTADLARLTTTFARLTPQVWQLPMWLIHLLKEAGSDDAEMNGFYVVNFQHSKTQSP
jgi:hypothetical protein